MVAVVQDAERGSECGAKPEVSLTAAAPGRGTQDRASAPVGEDLEPDLKEAARVSRAGAIDDTSANPAIAALQKAAGQLEAATPNRISTVNTDKPNDERRDGNQHDPTAEVEKTVSASIKPAGSRNQTQAACTSNSAELAANSAQVHKELDAAEKQLAEFKRQEIDRAQRAAKGAEAEAQNRKVDIKDLGWIDRLNGTARVAEKSAREAAEQATHLRSEQVRLESQAQQARDNLDQARAASQQAESLRQQGKVGEAEKAEKQAIAYSKNAVALLSGQKLDQRQDLQRAQAAENVQLAGKAVERTQTAIEVTKTVQTVAVGAGATVVAVGTGGAAAGLAYGFVAGTTIGTAGAAIEQSGYVVHGLKSSGDALNDFGKQVKESAITAATSSIGGVAGRALAGSAGLLAAGSSGAVSGLASSVGGDAIQVVEAKVFNTENQYSGLTTREIAGKIAQNAGWSAVAGFAGGMVGAGGAASRQVVKGVTKQLATRGAELVADAATGVGLEAARAKFVDDREYSWQEARNSILQSLGGSIVGNAQEHVNSSHVTKATHQRQAEVDAPSAALRKHTGNADSSTSETGNVIPLSRRQELANPAIAPGSLQRADQSEFQVRQGNNGAVFMPSKEALSERYVNVRSQELIKESFRRGEPISAQDAHTKAQSEVRNLGSFYDPESKNFYVLDPSKVNPQSKKERVEIGATIAHEEAHRRGLNEAQAWEVWGQHVIKNGFQPVLENGMARIEVLPPGQRATPLHPQDIAHHMQESGYSEDTRLAAIRGVGNSELAPAGHSLIDDAPMARLTLEPTKPQSPSIEQVAESLRNRRVHDVKFLEGGTSTKYIINLDGARYVFEPTRATAPYELGAIKVAAALGLQDYVIPSAHATVTGNLGHGLVETKQGVIRQFIDGASYERLGIPAQDAHKSARLFDLLIGDWDRTLSSNMGNMVREYGTGQEKWVDFGRAFQTDSLGDMVKFTKNVNYARDLVLTPEGKDFCERLAQVPASQLQQMLVSTGLTDKQVKMVIQRREELLKLAASPK